jgi:hypothetical protein
LRYVRVPQDLEELSSTLERSATWRVEDWIARANLALRRLGVKTDEDAMLTV